MTHCQNTDQHAPRTLASYASSPQPDIMVRDRQTHHTLANA